MRRWGARYGHKPVSRQAINGHFQRFGQYLWILIFKNPEQDFPYDKSWEGYKDLSFLRALVYLPGDYYAKRIEHIAEQNAHMERSLPESAWTYLRVYAQDAVRADEIKLLREVSERMQGIPENTFYIYWARAFWIVRLKKQGKDVTDRTACELLFEKLVEAFLSPLRDLPNINKPGLQRYFLYGVSLVKISFVSEDIPDKAERYFGGRVKPEIDNTVILPILAGAPDDLVEITPPEFLFLFDQMRELDDNAGSLALKKMLEGLRQKSLGIIDKAVFVQYLKELSGQQPR